MQERTSELAETNVQLQQEIGERRQAEEELKERAERLADFLTVAAHELRHPVSVVKGYATMLSGYLERMEPEDLHAILDALDVSVDRLTGHVEELMEASLVEEGRFDIRQAPDGPLAAHRGGGSGLAGTPPGQRGLHRQSPVPGWRW